MDFYLHCKLDIQAITDASLSHPKPNAHFSYGTAGFRTKANLLDSVMFRVGLLAALRSKNTRKVIGVMITASHNPPQDNGVKIIDPKGDMLNHEWEIYAAKLANVGDLEVADTLLHIAEKTNTNMKDEDFQAVVYVAKDTRQSSIPLSNALIDGVKAFGGKFHDYGLMTTPQLHFAVRHANLNNLTIPAPSENIYYEQISKAYRSLLNGENNNNATTSSLKKRSIIVDCADGVGGIKFKELSKYLQDILEFKIINDGTSADAPIHLLNEGAGAEFVQKQKQPPRNLSPKEYLDIPLVSVDGDSDRIVYFYFDSKNNNELTLLDGDKIASLFAKFIKNLIQEIFNDGDMEDEKIKIGTIQTAYANGSSTKFLNENLKVETPFVPTGVKHLHHKAEEYDVGIYFEANGHGTVLFNEKYEKILRSKLSKLNNMNNNDQEIKKKIQNINRLLNLPLLINQSAGDAITDLLLIEGICEINNIKIQEWNDYYKDIPSRMSKVVVKDRTMIKTNWEENQVTSPMGLQEKISEIFKNYKNGRAFVRPSGTEDIVRIYAEAETQILADELAEKICNLVSITLQ